MFFLVAYAVVISLVAIASIRITRFVHSPEFSRFLAAQAGEALKSEAKLAPLQWRGNSAASESLLLIGGATTAFERLEASVLRARWNWRALLNGIWKIEDVEIENLSATLKPITKPMDQADFTANSKSVAFWIPLKFELGRCDVRKADLRFGEIQGAGHTLIFEPVADGYDVQARGGSLSIPGFPPLALAQCRIRERKGIHYFDDARFFLSEGGSVSASGNSGRNARLTIAWEEVPVGRLPFSSLVKYLDGKCQGRATLDAKGVWSGNIGFTNARLHDLPLLKNAASLLGDSTWSHPQISKLDADFQWASGNLTLTNIAIESTNLARIEGGARIAADGALTGDVELGLDLKTLKLLPGAREVVFTGARNGWYWSTVRLGGTLTAPEEDLSPRLTACMAGAAILNQSGKALETVPSTAIDTAKEILNILTPLLP